MNNIEHAVSCFCDGFSCSQAILSIYGTKYGISREIALKIATAFGGGMARMGKTCGAVTGAFMVISLKNGRIKANDEESKEKTYELVRDYVRRFELLHESIECNELLNVDISSQEGRIYAKENNLFDKICPNLVKDSANILEEIL